MKVPFLLMLCGITAGLPMAKGGVPCTIDVSSAPTPVQLVERAPLILHVRARDYCRGTEAECTHLPNALAAGGSPDGAGAPASWSSTGVGASGLIDFEVVEVIKGPPVPGVVRVPGTLVDRDDFNEQPIPYTFVRRGGRSGNCFAFAYRAQREYLLFLRPGAGGLTPYWAPLAPINEQVRGRDDAWVVWVKRQARGPVSAGAATAR